MKTKSDITQLLLQVNEGSEQAYDELFPLIYQELKFIALSKVSHERDTLTVSATALVHEVYLKMVDQTCIDVNDKSHFMAIASRCMRQILVDHARKKQAEKRGGRKHHQTFADEIMRVQHETQNLIDLDEKLTQLADFDERMADIVTLRFIGQMPAHAIADVLSISERTVKRDWAKARGWLYKELKSG